MRTGEQEPLTPGAGLTDTRALRSACEALAAYLDRVRRTLDKEVRAYPTPIPRCDAQFNHLYEQRSRVAQALERTHAALREPTTALLAGAIAQFIEASTFSDDAEEESLKRRLRIHLDGRL